MTIAPRSSRVAFKFQKGIWTKTLLRNSFFGARGPATTSVLRGKRLRVTRAILPMLLQPHDQVCRQERRLGSDQPHVEHPRWQGGSRDGSETRQSRKRRATKPGGQASLLRLSARDLGRRSHAEV